MKTRGEKDQQPLLIECPDGAGSFFFFFFVPTARSVGSAPPSHPRERNPSLEAPHTLPGHAIHLSQLHVLESFKLE